ncbi:MAG: hypothetical protein HN794_06045 [Euryarchaeota archaeon]|jgi:hypothetical protein|nr:hypothetical protein [Euryarchaeota archaeon]MBT5736286.1 hypothetical protein [Euryarchaeota archaeon]MBT7460587.1 hypothetical protein [Euryarchaeota archaeon]
MSKSEKRKYKRFKFKRTLISIETGEEHEASLLFPLFLLLFGVPMLLYGVFLIINPQKELEVFGLISSCVGLFCNLLAALTLYSLRTGIYYDDFKEDDSSSGNDNHWWDYD